MRTISSAVGLLFLVALAATAAEPVAPAWSLPKADGEKWVRRVQALARDGWKATLRGNDIVLAREKPVRFVRVLPNAGPLGPGETRETPTEEGQFRLTLRYSPRMLLDEYERLAAVNAASEKERDRLHTAVAKLPQKFDQILATTDQEKQLVREYEAAVAKLPRHDLPDLYCDDYSIRLFTPGDGWLVVHDENVGAECRDMEQTVARAFGIYSPLAAKNQATLGRSEK